MLRAMTKRQVVCLDVAILLVISAGLIFSNLGNMYLWQDEAQTALISKTILTHGVPLGYDGKNYFSQELGKEYGKGYVWRWHTWLPFYVLAGFFAAFGTSNFACRLPFALAGIGTVILTYFFAGSLWHTRRSAVLAAILLLLNVPFLLLARQCRYYSMTALFSVAALYAYSEILKGRKYATPAFVISACLLFHTFYVYVPALLGAAIIHSAIFRRDRLKLVLAASIIAGAINLPWMIWLSNVYVPGPAESGVMYQTASRAIGFVVTIGKYLCLPALLVLPLLAMAHLRIRRRERPRADPEIVQHLVLLLLFAALVLIILGRTSPGPFFRYLAPLVPVIIMIEALILDRAMRIHPAVGLVVLALIAWHARMPDYLYEITHNYDGPIEGIVTYLNANGRDGDIVAAPHEDLPIKFYTKMRVIGALTGESLSDIGKADWIIRRKSLLEGRECQVMQLLAKKLTPDEFDEITLEGYPDITNENREDPGEHRFRTDEHEWPVVIYRRIER